MASVTITGTLRDAFGVALANHDILFEAIRTSDVVLNSTSAKCVTSNTGTYTFELGYGTYTLKIKSSRESQYRTVASNILVYSQVFDTHDLNFLLTNQADLQGIDESLLDKLLTVKADTLAYRDAAAASALASENSRIASAASASAALTSANNADISEANALTSANNADISEANALTSANNAGISEANAQKWAENPENVAVITGKYSAKHHAIKAAANAAAALTSANNADISEANALASANAADVSEANALASANTAEAAKTAAEAARDVANSSAGIYQDTTSGLAGTVTGEYFSVPSPLDDEVLILYRNDTGIATEVKRYQSAAGVESQHEAMIAMAASLVLTQSIIAEHHAFESQHEAMIEMAASLVLTQSIIAEHHAFV